MEKHIKSARVITNLFEHKFSLFGYSFGLDPIFGLVAGAGDFITVIVGFYFIWIGLQIGLPAYRILHMLFNILLDFILGSIPFLGDIFDFAYKAHSKNLAILEEHYEGRLIA